MLLTSAENLDDLASAAPGLSLVGWVVSPYLPDEAIRDLCRIARNLDNYRSATDAIREQGLKRANDSLVQKFARQLLGYERQARLVALYMDLPVLRRFSHLMEMAIIERYRLNYAAAVYMGLPLIEGLLLALSGWTVGDPQKSLRVALRELEPGAHLDAEHVRLFDLLKAQLQAFVDRAYERTDQGLGAAGLNRHYLLHGLGNDPATVPGNAARIILVFELLAALEQLNRDGTLWLPPESAVSAVEQVTRPRFYEECVRSGLSDLNLIKPEFLAHHPCFDRKLYFGEP